MKNYAVITGGSSGKGNARSATDYYPTPTLSTESLLELNLFGNIDTVLEPACGMKHISNAVQRFYPDATIESSDLHYYGDDSIEVGVDFLAKEYSKTYDLVITNPPYTTKLLMPFVEKSLKVSSRFVAMFLKITFLESERRYSFFTSNKNLKYVYIFSNRQPIYKNGEITKASNAICYAWYIWDKQYNDDPKIRWLLNKDKVKNRTEY